MTLAARSARGTVLLLLAGCASPTDAGVGAPLRIEVVSGADQSRLAGYVLAEDVVLRVVDDNGRPVPAVELDLEVQGTGAMVEPTEGTTGTQGEIAVRWRLGATVGAQQLRVTLPGHAAVPATQVTATATGAGVLAVDGIDQALCAVYADGRLGCWSPSVRSDADPPEVAIADTPLRFTGLAQATRFHSDLVYLCTPATTGRVWCTEFDRQGRQFTNWREVSGAYGSLRALSGAHEDAGVRDEHFCGLDPDGVAWCWGDNEEGELGDGTTISRDDQARPVVGGQHFASISVSPRHACALTAAGEAWCWGPGASGQLGRAPVEVQTAPLPVLTALRFTSVRAGRGRGTCATSTTNQLYCWGSFIDLVLDRSLIGGAASSEVLVAVPGVGSARWFGHQDFATYVSDPLGNGMWWGDLGSQETFRVLPVPTVARLPFLEQAGTPRARYICGRVQLGGGVSCVDAYALAGTGVSPVGDDFEETFGFGVPFPD